MEQWSESLLYFEVLHAASVEFDLATKDVPTKGGLTVLDTDKLAGWIKEVKQHLPDQADERIPSIDPNSPLPP